MVEDIPSDISQGDFRVFIPPTHQQGERIYPSMNLKVLVRRFVNRCQRRKFIFLL